MPALDPASWLTHLYKRQLSSDAAVSLRPEADQRRIETDPPVHLHSFYTDGEAEKRPSKTCFEKAV